MQGRRNPFVAQEGIPWLIATLVAGWLAYRYLNLVWVGAAAVLFVLLYLVFRDPRRMIPAVPLGAVSPVDGVVEKVELADRGVLQGEAQRVYIRIDALGTYTARCPVEGKIMNIATVAADKDVDYRTNALWVQTDEGDDVVLQFDGYRFGLPPRSFVRYGERIGQGGRCAYIRLARTAIVDLPRATQIAVNPGDRVVAGHDVLGRLPHP